MLELNTYSRQELFEIYKTERLDAIKKKLLRDGYEYTTSGRGKDFTLTVTKLPLRFRLFCIEQLHFKPQTDFKHLKKFLYRFMFDEQFRREPYVGMKETMIGDVYIGEATISKYVNQLYDENMIQFGNPIYYAINKITREYKFISEETYKTAWSIYYENIEYGYNEAITSAVSYAGGFPMKRGEIMFNAFENERIDTLMEILKEEINVDE